MGFCWNLDFYKWFGIRVVIRGLVRTVSPRLTAWILTRAVGSLSCYFESCDLALSSLGLVIDLVRLL